MAGGPRQGSCQADGSARQQCWVQHWQQIQSFKLDEGTEVPDSHSSHTNISSCTYSYNDLAGATTNICQMDGNDSAQSGSHVNSSDNSSERDGNSTLGYDSDEEVDSEPVRAVLVPGVSLPGQPPSLEVDESGRLQAPSNLPLTMVANFRSAYNKVDNIKK